MLFRIRVTTVEEYVKQADSREEVEEYLRYTRERHKASGKGHHGEKTTWEIVPPAEKPVDGVAPRLKDQSE